LKWKELERRLRSVSTDGVEASVYYYGDLDDPWKFELSSCNGGEMRAQPTDLQNGFVSMDFEQMIKLRDFLCELMGMPEIRGHDVEDLYVEKNENPA